MFYNKISQEEPQQDRGFQGDTLGFIADNFEMQVRDAVEDTETNDLSFEFASAIERYILCVFYNHIHLLDFRVISFEFLYVV